jgi:hypothetical protein
VFSYTIKRLITATRAVDGEWKRKSRTEIEDSYLGTLKSDAQSTFDVEGVSHVTNVVFRKSFEIDGVGAFELSLLDGDNLDAAIRLARGIVAGLPTKDYWYRMLLAWHHRDFHRVMSDGPIVSVRNLALHLRPSRIVVWPHSMTAEIWYSAGNLLGGARVCLEVDYKRRYLSANFG